MSESPDPTRPPLLSVSGDATPEEVAALVAVLQGMAAASAEAAARATQRTRSAWVDPARRARQPLAPGPGAWRSSALPR